jgi:hypothetical protein
MEEFRPMWLGAAALRVSPLNPDRGTGKWDYARRPAT